MAQLMELLERRRGELSDERFGVSLDLSGSTMYRYRMNQTKVGIDALHKMTPVFTQRGDAEVLGALAAYALGIDASTPEALSQIGQAIIDAQKATPSK